MLALVPAAFLVLVALAALAINSAAAYQSQQQLHDVLSAAATNAVTAGLSNDRFYAGGQLTLDPNAVAVAVCRTVDAQALAGFHQLNLAVAMTATSVRVTGAATIDSVFGRSVPGVGTQGIRSTADATLTTGPRAGGAAFGPVTPISCS
ncbi:MAG TPA: hypothetical protein VG435_09765 [Acidimicrobiales bacterium]|nr:hypothetical protein [Acidimicrobiales bacterium]